jgi:hypothetical protein
VPPLTIRWRQPTTSHCSTVCCGSSQPPLGILPHLVQTNSEMGSGRVSTSKFAVTLWPFRRTYLANEGFRRAAKGSVCRRFVHLQRNPPHLPPCSVIADRLRGDDGEPAEPAPGRRGGFRAPEARLFSFDRSRRLITQGRWPWPFDGCRLQGTSCGTPSSSLPARPRHMWRQDDVRQVSGLCSGAGGSSTMT